MIMAYLWKWKHGDGNELGRGVLINSFVVVIGLLYQAQGKALRSYVRNTFCGEGRTRVDPMHIDLLSVEAKSRQVCANRGVYTIFE
jgi:hypothetical protein